MEQANAQQEPGELNKSLMRTNRDGQVRHLSLQPATGASLLVFKVGFCSNSLPGKKERRQTAS